MRKKLRHVGPFLVLGLMACASAGAQTIAGLPARVAPPSGSEISAPSWGTVAESLLNVNAFAFDALSSSSTSTIATGGARYLTSGNGEWIGPVSLPTGALVTGLEVQGCDLSATGQLQVLLIRQVISGGTETIQILGNPLLTGELATPGCDNFSVAFATPATINNANAGYLLDVQQGGALDGSVRFQAVRVRYKLQVSLAPGTATFADVPTTSGQFRFVEALVAAGITAGCGGGNYCPDAPVTRGQMAVFLAAALGLHFPN